MAIHFFNERLYDMISVARPHDSEAERQWVNEFLVPYNPTTLGSNGYAIEVTRPDGTIPPILFSSHVDTVHRKDGPQQVHYDYKTAQYFKTDGEPLGADDTAGCWLMLEMIDAKVPGMYVFHRGEERGGIGSRTMSNDKVYADWLSNFKCAVAFDRRGVGDVITHQGWGRCCSDEFAQSLSDAINATDDGLMYSPCNTGVFTDTANYVDLIAECTNVSCGYYSEHTGNETLNLQHLFALRDALIKVDWEALPIVRAPGDDDYGDYWAASTSRYGAYSTSFEMERRVDSYEVEVEVEDLRHLTHSEMLEMAYDAPELLVDLVFQELWGYRPSLHDDDEKGPKLKVGMV